MLLNIRRISSDIASGLAAELRQYPRLHKIRVKRIAAMDSSTACCKQAETAPKCTSSNSTTRRTEWTVSQHTKQPEEKKALRQSIAFVQVGNARIQLSRLDNLCVLL